MSSTIRWLTRVLRFALGCLVASLLIGTFFNSFENWNLNRLHPVPGRIYNVAGYPMHLYCIGTGSPTVVLESGLGNDWLIWQKIQPWIAATNRVCSYDRAGLGWSAPQPGSRGALAIARQLDALLSIAGIHDALLLVGHSAGGLYVRAFTAMFPNRVVGLVLVEASSPEAFHALPSPALRRQLIAQRHREAPWLFFKVSTGLARLSSEYCNPNTSQRIPQVRDLARAEDCRPAYINSWLGEWDEFEKSADQVYAMPCCDSIPLVIVSEDPGPPNPSRSQQLHERETWDTLQERLKGLSFRSMRIIARNSQHYVMVDRPEVVLDAIHIVDSEIRRPMTSIEAGQTIWR